MRVIPLHDAAGVRAYAVVLDTGEDPVAVLTSLAAEHAWRASRFMAIGAFSSAVLAFFNLDTREYERIPVNEQMEVLSFAGDIGIVEGAPKVHAHAVVGLRDGSTRGGHVMEARVRPTLEIMLTDWPAELHRELDAETGLHLIRSGSF